MDLSFDVLISVVDELVKIIIAQFVVGLQRIGEDFASRLHMLLYKAMKFPSLPSFGDGYFDTTLPFKKADDECLVLASGPGDLLGTNPLVHVPGFAADERLIDLDL